MIVFPAAITLIAKMDFLKGAADRCLHEIDDHRPLMKNSFSQDGKKFSSGGPPILAVDDWLRSQGETNRCPMGVQSCYKKSVILRRYFHVATSRTAGNCRGAVVVGSQRLYKLLSAVARRFVSAGVRREHYVDACCQPRAAGDLATACRADCTVESRHRLVAARQRIR